MVTQQGPIVAPVMNNLPIKLGKGIQEDAVDDCAAADAVVVVVMVSTLFYFTL